MKGDQKMIDSSGATLTDWVPETRFGTWFQSHWMWTDYVLRPACDDLVRMIAGREPRYPTIMDAGCGAGHAFDRLASEFDPDEIIAIEIDPESVRLAEVKAFECGWRVSVKHGSVESTLLDDSSVDMIFCHQTIHHVVNQSRTVREFYRVLKPQGVLLMSESCQQFVDSFLVRTLFRHPARTPCTAQEFIELLRKGGFEVTDDMISYPDLFWARPSFGLLSALGRTGECAAQNIFNCIAIKEAV
jgi:2-polyprenyl-3-methyl-5-hydroxy-6-metoxy-1,4-benzoquinol methylase